MKFVCLISVHPMSNNLEECRQLPYGEIIPLIFFPFYFNHNNTRQSCSILNG